MTQEPIWQSVGAFDDFVGRYRAIGIDEFAFHWPPQATNPNVRPRGRRRDRGASDAEQSEQLPVVIGTLGCVAAPRGAERPDEQARAGVDGEPLRGSHGVPAEIDDPDCRKPLPGHGLRAEEQGRGPGPLEPPRERELEDEGRRRAIDRERRAGRGVGAAKGGSEQRGVARARERADGRRVEARRAA